MLCAEYQTTCAKSSGPQRVPSEIRKSLHSLSRFKMCGFQTQISKYLTSLNFQVQFPQASDSQSVSKIILSIKNILAEKKSERESVCMHVRESERVEVGNDARTCM